MSSAFVFLNKIGSGFSSTVFLAIEKKNNRNVAIKELTDKKLYDQEVFVLTTMNKITTKFFPKFFYNFEENNKFYVVMEFIAGGDLFSRVNDLAKKNIPLLAAQLSAALQTLHKNNILFGDLKAENLMLDHHGFVKIIDFGSSITLKTPSERCSLISGTHDFFAPEMVELRGYSFPVDWWCLGCLLFELYFEKMPYKRHSFPSNEVEQKKMLQIYANEREIDFSALPPLEETTTHFLAALLRRNENDRLGTKSEAEVVNHPYFADIKSWNFSKKEVSSLKPVITRNGASVEYDEHNKIDLTYFEGDCYTLFCCCSCYYFFLFFFSQSCKNACGRR